MVLPLALAAALALAHAALLTVKTLVQGRSGPVGRHSHVLIACLILLCYALYLYETSTLLSVFDCAPTPPSTIEYLTPLKFEECGVPGGVQQTLMPVAVVGLVVYTAGFPLGALWVLLRNREVVMEDQLLRAKGVGGDRLTNPHAYEVGGVWG